MNEAVGFVELEEQRMELLPPRTLMTMMNPMSGGGGGDLNYNDPDVLDLDLLNDNTVLSDIDLL